MKPSEAPQVLVGIDPGPEAESVVRFAAREAALRGAPLHLHHALGRHTSTPDAAGDLFTVAETVLKPYMALVRNEFPQVKARTVADPGAPAAGLVDRSPECALIVLGRRGSGGFARLVVGSVSMQVATHANCPVTVVQGEPPAPWRVVVGVDRPEEDQAALEFAAEEALLRDVPLHLVHAESHPQALPLGMAPPGQSDQAGLLHAAQQILDQEAHRWQELRPGLRTSTEALRTNAAAALVEASHDAGLLVVGTHQRNPLTRVLLGSVSAHLLHHAHCPVTVVPRQ
ncbi:universal stress protein [Kitasatospora sp. NBC_00070]|uniref:universal stress protein n=1 Tax=Kitasatospora sp. NBC_00070 TaxID=2975962 RepID=UPI003250667A